MIPRLSVQVPSLRCLAMNFRKFFLLFSKKFSIHSGVWGKVIRELATAFRREP